MTNKFHVIKLLSIVILCTLGMFTAYKTLEVKQVFSAAEGKYIIIIIDDYGYRGAGTDEILELGIPVTAAVMPGMAYSEEDARKYYEAGSDVILHQPMEPKKGKDSWLGPFGITSDLSDAEVSKNVNDGLKCVKYAVGINNHMGSKIMENERIISMVMQVTEENGLIFIDSKTTQKSVAKKIAEDLGVRYYERDFFLDDVKSVANTRKQLLNAAKLADKRGYAIVIGHVGSAGGATTASGLKSTIPELLEEGYKFITISELKLLMDTDMGLSHTQPALNNVNAENLFHIF